MRTFIFGTDWWSDCDDAVALKILCNAHKKGEITLAGIAINACMEYSVASVDGFLAKEGINSVPIGIDLEATDFSGVGPYQKRLSQYAVRYKKNEDAENAVRLYRKILASAAEKVEIIEVGFLNVFASLLESEPDLISEKSGIELVKEKVSHIWVMAGKWDENGGKEHNFCNNHRSRKAARIFCEKCPARVTFLGFEIGVDVISGQHLSDGVLKDVLTDHRSENGRSSWDPMTAALALAGEPEKAGYSVVKGTARVDEADGSNFFRENENGLHRFVKRNFPAEYYSDIINSLID
ncbi:MAG: hypothetical protein IJE93_03430 [Clostridia bacterium]|nr:hypothetical protein [Clostridia bacterium]